MECTDVSAGDWFITMLISAIPVVGFVMLFVWAFGNGTNTNKANWAKASLIWLAVIFSTYLLLFFALLVVAVSEGNVPV